MKRLKLLPVLLLLLLHACVTLDQVHTFSTNACDILKSIRELDYSFSKSYIRYDLGGEEFDVSLPNIPPDPVKQKVFAQADATISLFSNTLLAYFGGLGRLSDEGTGKTDFSKLGAAIKGDDKVLGLLHVTKDQVDAGVSLSTTLANALTRQYKEEQIKEIILSTHASVDKVIDALSSSLSALQLTTENNKGLLKTKYVKITLDPGIDKGARIAFVREYRQQIGDLEKSNRILEDQKQGLESLKNSLNDLTTQLKDKKLSAQEVLSLLQQYSGELITINDQIKKLVK